MAIKLLLVDDVEDLGRSGDIVNVRPGYARNFLLPQGCAIIADRGALLRQASLKKMRDEKAIVDKQESEALAARIEGQTLSTIVKVDHDGHMYGSVSTNEIAHLINEQLSITVEKRNILLKHALKETGVHKVNVKLKEGITASFSLDIVPEEVNPGSSK